MYFRPISNHDSVARQDATSAKRDARSANTEINFLKQEVERLLMITEGLWELIKQNTNLTDEELHNKVIEIDARDGKIDGKVKPSPPKKCSNCNKILARRKPFCMYCGEIVNKDIFER